MPLQSKKRKTGTSDSEPGGDQQGQGEEVLDKGQKIEVEIVHIFKTKPENLQHIWKSFADWVKQWAD